MLPVPIFHGVQSCRLYLVWVSVKFSVWIFEFYSRHGGNVMFHIFFSFVDFIYSMRVVQMVIEGGRRDVMFLVLSVIVEFYIYKGTDLLVSRAYCFATVDQFKVILYVRFILFLGIWYQFFC